MKFLILLSLTVTILHSVYANTTPKEDDFDYQDTVIEFPSEIFVPYDNENVNISEGVDPAMYAAVVGNANAYLDNLLEQAKSNFGSRSLDPLPVDDVEKTFKKGKIIKLKGGFKTKNGKLKGLMNLRRSGDATLEYLGDHSKIRATLAVNDLKVQMDARAWFSKLSVSWYMGTTVKYLRATIEVIIPNEAGAKPRATSLVVNEIGTIYVDIKKLGPLNWVLDGLAFLVTNMLKTVLKNKIASNILNAIN